MSSLETPFDRAVAALDAVHAGDPRVIDGIGGALPFSVVYHAAITRWVNALAPSASLPLRLAARAQHLGRYAIPRATFPEGPLGYKQWRSTLARKHAADAAEILAAAGFDPSTIDRVADLLMKKRLTSDAEAAVLEDAACLTFLELELGPFIAKTEPAKVAEVLRKTWRKMSPAGRDAARALLPSLQVEDRAVVERALSETTTAEENR